MRMVNNHSYPNVEMQMADEYAGDLAVLQKGEVDKDFIRRRLAWISQARTSSNPPRALLNSLNSVLMPGW